MNVNFEELATTLQETDNYLSDLPRYEFAPDDIIMLKLNLLNATGKCFRVIACEDEEFEGMLWFVNESIWGDVDLEFDFMPEDELCELDAFHQWEDYDEIIETFQDYDYYVCKTISSDNFFGKWAMFSNDELWRIRMLIKAATGKECHIFRHDTRAAFITTEINRYVESCGVPQRLFIVEDSKAREMGLKRDLEGDFNPNVDDDDDEMETAPEIGPNGFYDELLDASWPSILEQYTKRGFACINNIHYIEDADSVEMGLELAREDGSFCYFYVDDGDIWAIVSTMSPREVDVQLNNKSGLWTLDTDDWCSADDIINMYDLDWADPTNSPEHEEPQGFFDQWGCFIETWDGYN